MNAVVSRIKLVKLGRPTCSTVTTIKLMPMDCATPSRQIAHLGIHNAAGHLSVLNRRRLSSTIDSTLPRLPSPASTAGCLRIACVLGECMSAINTDVRRPSTVAGAVNKD